MKSLKSRAGILISVLSLLVVSVPFSVASAQTGNQTGLAFSPPTFDLSAEPGQVLHESIKVDNLTTNATPVKASVENFVAVGDQGDVGLTNNQTAYSLAQWISVNPSSTVIPAKASSVFNFTVNVPANAEPGGRFGSIVFQTNSGSSGSKTGVGVSQQFGSLILLRIAGNAREQASIVNMSSSFSKGNQVIFKTLIKNSGNVQVKPIGNLVVTNMFGDQVNSQPFGGKYVIPGAERQYDNVWTYKGILFGKYTATVTLIYGSKNTTLSYATSFISIPWKLILICLLIIVIIVAVLYKARRRIFKALRILFGKE